VNEMLKKLHASPAIALRLLTHAQLNIVLQT
jgi:hypothetical protein